MRKLVASLVCAGGLVASSAQALDLGALHVYSEAGQPLDAEIQLLDVEGLRADDIRPRFAGVDDLALSGLDNKRYLSGVRFFVAIEKDQSATLRLVSEQPINQTFLSFLLEVNWPQGRLLREYTALLKGEVKKPDPVSTAVAKPKVATVVGVETDRAQAPINDVPVKSVEVVAAPPAKPVLPAMKRDVSQDESVSISKPSVNAQAPSVVPSTTAATVFEDVEPESKSADVIEHSHPIEITKPVFVRDSERIYVNEAPKSLAGNSVKVEPDQPMPAVSAPEGDGSKAVNDSINASSVSGSSVVDVGNKETLWDIARRYRPEGELTNQQMMLALYEKNPKAFVDGDINRMKGHAVLQLPTQSELERHSHSEALRKIRLRLNESNKLAAKEMQAVSRAKEVVVGPKETLWDIAVKYRAGPEVNTRQMMLAIVKKNPHAFVGGNINQMLKGVVLKMPTVEELRQWSAEDASAEVRRQISDWRSGDVVAPKVTVQPAGSEPDKALKPEAEPIVDAANAKRRVIGKKETLWSIALQHLPDESVTTGEMIKAIIKKNPHAFVNGNMNEMRVGEVLEMPTLAEIRAANGR